MPDSVQIEKHPSERRRSKATTLGCGCSCCCCCCLHTIGSLVGAERAAPREPATYLHGPSETSSVAVFWRITWILVVLVMVLPILFYQNAEAAIVAGMLILIGLPAIQLASAFITFFAFVFLPGIDREFELKQVARITAGIVIGSIIGFLAMAAIPVVFQLFS